MSIGTAAEPHRGMSVRSSFSVMPRLIEIASAPHCECRRVHNREVEDFRRHAGWCPRGQPADGRQRLDLFPDYGAPLPIWQRGVGRFNLNLSPDLRRKLAAWGREWEDNVDPDDEDSAPSAWREPWAAEGTRLGRELEAETGYLVVVLEPYGPDRANDCPNCGRPWLVRSAPS